MTMTSMQRFDPFREMRQFSRLLNGPLWAAQRWGDPLEDDDVVRPGAVWGIPMDVRRDDQQLTVQASLPGFAADEVEVSISPDRALSVKAARQSEATRESEEYLLRERRTGSFARAIRLPGDLDLDAVTVVLEHGVLTVTAPVAAAAQTRRLPIGGAAAVADDNA